MWFNYWLSYNFNSFPYFVRTKPKSETDCDFFDGD